MFAVFGGALGLGIIEVKGYDPLVARIIGWVAALFFLLALVVWARRLLRGKQVVIRIDDKGIHDTRLSREPIPWQHIRGVSVMRQSNVSYLTLDMSPADKEHFLLPSAKLGSRLNGMPTISASGLQPSVEDLRFAIHRLRPRQ
ncbi:hypothetical protein SAMN05421869_10830 [Nonomuraea jiangxiensis]|uniref:PH domain-containing protein n=1 Tax=Nonomuraea jiangxiensis TaxID=633440 RepID=A0A1G8PUR5_9ACTN|nr:hypothetical protein SAMN05421869_10830 [Nonomuraea jiangxiensis]